MFCSVTKATTIRKSGDSPSDQGSSMRSPAMAVERDTSAGGRPNTGRTRRPTVAKTSTSRIIGCSLSLSVTRSASRSSRFGDFAEKDVHHRNGIKWDNRPGNIEPVEHARHASITQEQVRAWAEDEKRERQRHEAGVVDGDVCDGCGEQAEPLATSPGFAGERCLECARQECDGEPIEV